MKNVFFTVADQQNMGYAKMMEKSLKYFHSEAELRIYSDEELFKTGMEKSKIFYLATPYFASKLFTEGYEVVIKIDADSLVLSDISELWSDKSYDVGTVLNWNRVDSHKYGEIGLLTISPQEYYNNGFVVMKNSKFVEEWLRLCNSIHFERMPFREQGFLNLLTHYFNFKVKLLDIGDSWWGLISKGEWLKAIVKDEKIIIPKSEDKFPNKDMWLRVIHWAGGVGESKMKYKINFNEEVSEFMNKITGGY